MQSLRLARAAAAGLLAAVLLTSPGEGRASPLLYFVHTDHLNSPRLIADGNQTTVWRWDQVEPFGANAPDEDPDGNSVIFHMPFRFPGQYFDKETNLHYNMARDYASDTGRYIQSDPIGLRGGLNTYLYVGGDPLRRIDPLGLLALCPPGPKMKKCLEKIFGQSIEGIEVVIDPPMIERHFGPGVEGATTRQGKIYINVSCDRFWGDPEFVLHEHYHVVQQWGNEGMTIPGYLIQFPTKEREAKDFAAKNVNRLKECLLCAEPR